MEFQEALAQAITQHPTPFSEKVKAILDRPDSLRKRIILHAMERHAVAQLNHLKAIGAIPEDTQTTEGLIDWSTVDWQQVLGFIIKILVMILPLL